MARITDEVKQAISQLTEQQLAQLYMQAIQEAEDKQQTAEQKRKQAIQDIRTFKPK